MTEISNKLDEMSHQFNENILAVKGTLELMDSSVTEDDLHDLLLKAMQRMDNIQILSNDMLAALQNCLNKIGSGNK
ncbi:MAG: hypothetical protein P8Z71_01795 [Candidatus Sulfobium sp.]|jgi:hypothetical protein